MSLAMRMSAALVAIVMASALASAQGRFDGSLMAQRRSPMQQRGPRMQMPAPQAQPPPQAQQQRQPQGSMAERPMPPHRGPHAGQWLRKILSLPVQQQQQALESDPQFQQLPPERQQRLRNRLEQFNNLAPDQQQRILDRMDRFGHLSPEQQHQARQLFRQFRDLAPERKKAVMSAYHALRDVKEEDRDRTLGSPQFQSLSDDERSLVKGFTSLDLGPQPSRTDDDNPPE